VSRIDQASRASSSHCNEHEPSFARLSVRGAFDARGQRGHAANNEAGQVAAVVGCIVRVGRESRSTVGAIVHVEAGGCMYQAVCLYAQYGANVIIMALIYTALVMLRCRCVALLQHGTGDAIVDAAGTSE
jgi:hypothetical protein